MVRRRRRRCFGLPAPGSGSLATVIQDLASIAAYLMVAMRVVG
jgi:hypothetical protein